MSCEKDLLVLFRDSKILFDTLNSNFFFSKDKFSKNFNIVKTFTHNDKKIFVGTFNSPKYLKDYSLIGLRELFPIINSDDFFILSKSLQIYNWSRHHKFCGACGKETFEVNESEFSKFCQYCEINFYPRISPVVMALIKRNDQILLARSHHFPKGMFSALAGFCEVGESLSMTLDREIYEEVGIYVNNHTYFSSQSWPFPHSLMIAFECDYVSGKIKIDKNEIEDAKWFSKNKISCLLPSKMSIARRLIDNYLGII
jgi:NAD+ diphosphatase